MRMMTQLLGELAALMAMPGDAKVDWSRFPLLSPVGREARMGYRFPERRSYLASRREARRRRNIRMHRRARA